MLFSINLDDLSAMTPPAHDEPFFRIRLPIAKRGPPKGLEPSSTDIDATISSLNLETDVTSVKAVDYSQECKKYYDGIENGEFQDPFMQHVNFITNFCASF